MLKGKKILLGVTGGIAAYKSCELVRLYQKQGADVKVVMTEAASKFVTPLTFAALTRHEVEIDLFDNSIKHIELAKWADLFVIAPATANTIAKLAHGIADNLLTNIALASTAPILIAPAMNANMYINEATQDNLKLLAKRNIKIIDPDDGYQACGDIGKGRLADLIMILEKSIQTLFKANQKTIVITAGATREPLDPVRYLTNHSSGKMGYALATAAAKAGYSVKLISGVTNLPKPYMIDLIKVDTADEMLAAVMKEVANAQIFIGCAAVADFKAKSYSSNKIKKNKDQAELTLSLSKNPDIIKEVANLHKLYTVGFAAETTNLIEYAKAKIQSKDLDLIIANDVSNSEIGFNSDQNKVTLIYKDLHEEELPLMSKLDLAEALINKITNQIGK